MLTPLDIESKNFEKGFYGFRPSDVRLFLKEVLNNYETLYRENIEMKDKVNTLNEGIQYYKTVEDTLQNTLVLAEQTAEELKKNARRKAEIIEKEAEVKAREIVDNALAEAQRISQSRETLVRAYDASKIQLQQFLKAQLAMIEKNELTLETKEEVINQAMANIKKEEKAWQTAQKKERQFTEADLKENILSESTDLESNPNE